MTPLHRLQLAAALAHTAPRAELRLHTVHGETVVVGTHPAADIDPCAMRRVVGACADDHHPVAPDLVDAVEIGGALGDLGGGVYRLVHDGVEQRWIATLLPPHRVATLLDDVGLATVADDAMHARLKPDAGLGVTLLVITSNDRSADHALDEVAAQAAAACFVAEMIPVDDRRRARVGRDGSAS